MERFSIMIGFSNLDSLICLCGARNRFGALGFTGGEAGNAAYTAADLAKAVGAVKISGDKSAQIKMLIADSRRGVFCSRGAEYRRE